MSDRYQKQASFVGLRQRQEPPDPLPRLIRAAVAVENLPWTIEKKSVVRQAVEELQGNYSPEGHTPFVLHDHVRAEIARLTDEELPRYLYYRFRYDTSGARKRVDDFPPCVQIEPTSVCNYRCVFCYQTDDRLTKPDGGHRGFMDLQLFKKIVDECEGRCEAVTLASRGEPLLHPQIAECLAYVRGKFLALKVNTNASVLDERKSHALLETDPQTLVFSVDASTEDQYRTWRVGGDLKRVMANIGRFQEIRAKRYPKARVITRVSGVKIPESPGLNALEDFWGNLVDQVALVNYNPWENTYERPVNDIQEPCSALWFRLFVWWDGRVNPCDNDYLSHLSVGNALRGDLSDLWRSEAFARIRQCHADRRRRDVFPCDRCQVI